MEHTFVVHEGFNSPTAKASDSNQQYPWIVLGAKSASVKNSWDLMKSTSGTDFEADSVEASVIGFLTVDDSFPERLETRGTELVSDLPEVPSEFLVYIVNEDGEDSGLVAETDAEAVSVISEEVSIIDAGFDLEREIYELKGVFPDIEKEDFYNLENGNVGVVVEYEIVDYPVDEFTVMIEFPDRYPTTPPLAWVLKPEIDSSCPHIWPGDKDNVRMDYIDPSAWENQYTAYDAAVLVKTWVHAYCNWKYRGDWKWKANDNLGGDIFD